jgi:hypothetical protein
MFSKAWFSKICVTSYLDALRLCKPKVQDRIHWLRERSARIKKERQMRVREAADAKRCKIEARRKRRKIKARKVFRDQRASD